MRRGLKHWVAYWLSHFATAARAAPYEKGTETDHTGNPEYIESSAARAAPYEKGTETAHRLAWWFMTGTAARAAPYEKGTETPSATR